jgi:hypothetical protein
VLVETTDGWSFLLQDHAITDCHEDVKLKRPTNQVIPAWDGTISHSIQSALQRAISKGMSAYDDGGAMHTAQPWRREEMGQLI